jgi:16S rRNA (cytidine1402-2'-O)-methyltransferase
LSELILVTLPIGNSKDITLRALETLKSEKIFYAEDTRVFKQALESFGISNQEKSIDSFHDQSIGKIDLVLKKLAEGQNVCLVSDAGSPIISDPAYPLIKKCIEEGYAVKTVPGVTSVTTALELSGLPPHPFHFWGFIGRSKNERRDFFTELGSVKGTHLFFESPHRLFESIESFFEIFPEHQLIVAKELTKTFETVYRIVKSDLPNLSQIIVDKGEFVVLFHNESGAGNSVEFKELQSMITDYLAEGGGPKKLAKIFAKALGSDTKTIYDQLNRSAKS